MLDWNKDNKNHSGGHLYNSNTNRDQESRQQSLGDLAYITSTFPNSVK